MAGQYFEGTDYHTVSIASITDTTPPTFAGIATLTVQPAGQLRATWLAGTDISTPIEYEVYIQADTATGLFSPLNIVQISSQLLSDVFTLPDGNYLAINTTYYVGVRAVDAVGNRETNTVSLSAVSTGVVAGTPVYQAQGAFTVGQGDLFQGTIWATKNNILLATSLGTASYTVYDKTGAAVSGMSESGITADANGQFKITPVDSNLAENLDHYVIKVTVTADSSARIGYVPLVLQEAKYKAHGVFSINSTNQLLGTLWVSVDDIARTTFLGAANYTIYDASGVAVPTLTQSGITADGNGRYIITPVTSTLQDLTHYTIKIGVVCDDLERVSYKGLTIGI